MTEKNNQTDPLHIALAALHTLAHAESRRFGLLDRIHHPQPELHWVARYAIEAMREVEKAGGPKAPH